MRAEDEYYAYFELSKLDYASGLTVNSGVSGARDVDTDTNNYLNRVLGTEGLTTWDAIIADLVDFSDIDVSDSVAGDTVRHYSLGVKVVGNSGRVYFEKAPSTDWTGYETMKAQVKEDVTVYITLETDYNSDKIDDRNEVEVTVYKETKIGSNEFDAVGRSVVVEKGTDLSTVKNFPFMNDRLYDEDGVQYRLVYDTAKAGDTHTTVKGYWAKYTEGMDRFEATSTNDKDTNGDGKVSCDEYYGTTGLEWSDKLNACVVSSTGDAVVTIPNTATK